MGRARYSREAKSKAWAFYTGMKWRSVFSILPEIKMDGLFFVKFLDVKFNVYSSKDSRVICVCGPTEGWTGGRIEGFSWAILSDKKAPTT
jgi:hypothetical protein